MTTAETWGLTPAEVATTKQLAAANRAPFWGAVDAHAPTLSVVEEPAWPDPVDPEPSIGRRHLRYTAASTVPLRRPEWLWQGMLALGSLATLVGREGLGKSTLTIWLVARLTRGELPGERLGAPASVIIAATEDSWEYTLAPRLVAAGADLSRVYRIDVIAADGAEGYLSLPVDVRRLEQAVTELDAVLVILDPLMSRLAADLDSHKDGDVRRALEPLTALAERTRVVVLGLMHLNKSRDGDPLDRVMGSRAFVAVPRSVLTVVSTPEDDGTRLLGQTKNNLGPLAPSMLFRIVTATVPTDDGPAHTSAVEMLGETLQTVADVMRDGSEDSEVRTATGEAAGWLTDYLEVEGGRAESAAIKKAGAAAGHNIEAVKRARRRLPIVVESVGYPRRTWWALSTVGSPSGESVPTELTNPTDPTVDVHLSGQSVQSGQSEPTPRECDPTEGVLL